MKTLSTNFGNIEYPETVGSANGTVVAKEWEKDGKCRIYFTVYFSDGGKVDCGYIDMITKSKNMASRPANIARTLKEEIVFS